MCGVYGISNLHKLSLFFFSSFLFLYVCVCFCCVFSCPKTASLIRPACVFCCRWGGRGGVGWGGCANRLVLPRLTRCRLHLRLVGGTKGGRQQSMLLSLSLSFVSRCCCVATGVNPLSFMQFVYTNLFHGRKCFYFD